MWDYRILGIDLYHIIQWFVIYSFLGWVWETCYVSVKSRRFVNRGFVNGPFCTIYGFGAISVYLILRPLEGRWVLLFFGGMAVATALEYITAALMETIFHTTWWDYSEKKLNFQGRICLGASLGWGAFTLLLFRVLQPFVEWIVGLYSVTAGKTAVIVLALSYIVDFSFSAATAFQLSQKFPSLEQAVEEKKAEFIRQLEKYRHLEPGQLVEEAGESLERLRDNFTDTLLQRLDALELSQLKKGIDEIKKQWASRQNYITRRYLRAYPHLNRGHRLKQFRKRNKEEHKRH
ncbi:MAG TPA: hypothetical protein IAA45_00400 [Candidatus Blautia gallistercoris]|uniref:ABC-transporter type IV n=1 Tax=Candidatus Blautia gallistercoris TaxID=2838490 RepID=A0A9D2B1Z0_9FIRM|nr:hypothetical protein [Candidatus Blautia gallistercoris]